MELESEIENNLALNKSPFSKLDYYLNYELSSSALYILGICAIAIYPVVMIIITITAVIFTPYLLFILYKEKKFGWITAFFIMVVLPLLINILFISDYFSNILNSIIIGLFYLFCYILKMSTRDWVAEDKARFELNKKRELKKIEEETFNIRYKK